MKKPSVKLKPIECGVNVELLRVALNASTCAVTIADASQKDMPLIYVNSTFERMTGYPPSEVLGKNCRFLQAAKRDQPGIKVIRKALKEHKPCTVNLENFKKNGYFFWNELHLAPIFDSKGKLTHYVGVQTDVTQRVLAEQALEKQQHHLEELVTARTQKLAEKNIALQEILSQIELEKKKVKDQVVENIDSVIMPLLLKLKAKLAKEDQKYGDLIEKNLQELTATFGSSITRKLYRLTPREIEISNMIRSGLASKDIAQFFHVSPSTIENQRNTIRKKLGISKQAVNLTAYLQSLTVVPPQ